MALENGSIRKEKIIVHVDEDLEELIPDFFEMRREDINSISGAVEKGDYKTIEILGHSMKGAGGGYGFDEISVIGKVIEEAAKESNNQEIQKGVKALSDYLDCVEVVYEKP